MDSSIILPEGSDPTPQADAVKVYAKDVGGVAQLFAEADDGTITQLTPGGGSSTSRYFPPEQWTQKAVAASQTDVALSAQVSTDYDTWKAVRAGSITGLSTRLTSAVTAGTLTVQVTINGAGGTLTLAHTSISNASGGIVTQAAGVDTFSAGDLLAIRLTTTVGFTPTTTDLEAYIECEDA